MLRFTGERLAREDVITGELEQINFASAGFIDKAEGSDLKIEPLITSSKEAMAIHVSKVNKEPKPARLTRSSALFRRNDEAVRSSMR